MKDKRSIMIVDDDIDTSYMMKSILESSGLYEVMVCNEGREAVTRVREAQPELLLLDIVMPDADGAEIAARLRKDSSAALTRIVFMTSLVSEAEAAQDPTIGGHPFISKPISGAALLERVRGFF